MKFPSTRYEENGGESHSSDMHALISDLASDDMLAREKARNALIDIGTPAVDYLAELAYTKRDIVRWEAVKTLGEIADPDSIPVLVDSLEDDNSGIRWLAAEGLIRLGRAAIAPLLLALIQRPNSMRLRQGLHHVFQDIEQGQLRDEMKPLLIALRKPASKEKILITAGHLLKKFRTYRA